MKKIMKRLIACFLAVVLAAGCFAGCGNQSTDNTNPQGGSASAAILTADNGETVMPIVKESITLTVWWPLESWALGGIQTLNDNEVFKKLEEMTGINLEFIHPPLGMESEKFNLMLADDELPDIIVGAGMYPGGGEKGVEDGVYIALNDLITKYAPNYDKARNQNDETRKQTTSDSGMLWCVNGLSPYETWCWWGPMIRKDWLDELNLEVPETIEEWENVLTQFKEKKGATAPIIWPSNGVDGNGSVFVGAYDTAPTFYQKDGKVQYGPMDEGYKSFLETANRWYNKGLIAKDFSTMTDWNSIVSLLVSGKAGAIIQSPDTVLALTDTYNIEMVPAPYPVLEKGDALHFRQTNNYAGGSQVAITTSCKYPEAAMKLLDYGFTEAGMMLYNYGIEGQSYVMEDGKPVFTDLIYNNPDGIPVLQTLWKYKLHSGPYLRVEHESNPVLLDMPLSQEWREKWTEIDDSYVLPPISFTVQESKKINQLMAAIHTYNQETMIQFVTGLKPLSEFDSYVQQLKKYKIDEVLAIYDAALDRYEKR